METCGAVRFVESLGDVEDQGFGDILSEENVDDEYLFRCVMWADKYWFFSDHKSWCAW